MSDEAITLRRRVDDEMTETLREYRGRIADTVERLTRIDEALSFLKVEFQVARESRINIQEQQTAITERLTALSDRFVAHIEDESAERALLQEMTRQVSGHSERLTMVERMQIAIWSALGTVAVGGVTWVIGHLTITAAR